MLDLEVLLTPEASEKYREMTLPRKFVRGNLRSLLEHPLSEAFLTLKHRLLQCYAILNVVWYLLFALSLTSVGIISTKLRVDLGLSGKPCDELSASLSTCPYLLPISGSKDYPQDYIDVAPFWAFYLASCVLLASIFFRGAVQFFVNWRRFLSDGENWLELLMMAFSLGYLLALILYDCLSPHLGAISVLLVWAEFSLIIGQGPIV